MDFKAFEESLLAYFQNNLATKLDQGVPPPVLFLLDLPDVQSKTEPIIFYLYIPEYEFEQLTMESKALNAEVNIFVTLQGVGVSNTTLDSIAKSYMKALYTLIESNKTLFGIVDNASCEKIHYYDAVFGIPSGKAIEMLIRVEKEVGLI